MPPYQDASEVPTLIIVRAQSLSGSVLLSRGDEQAQGLDVWFGSVFYALEESGYATLVQLPRTAKRTG